MKQFINKWFSRNNNNNNGGGTRAEKKAIGRGLRRHRFVADLQHMNRVQPDSVEQTYWKKDKFVTRHLINPKKSRRAQIRVGVY